MTKLFIAGFCLISFGCGKEAIMKRPTRCVKLTESAQHLKKAFDIVFDEFQYQDPALFNRDENCIGDTVYVATTSEGWTFIHSDGREEVRCGARTNELGEKDYIINLCPTIKPTWEHLPIVIIHETGHTFKMGHSKDPNNVMYYSTQKAKHTVSEAVSDVLYAAEHYLFQD